MCLNNAKQIKQHEDIKCYKVLITETFNREEIIRSPHFSRCVWSMYIPNRIGCARPQSFFSQINGEEYIEGAAFHTFVNLEDAKKYCKLCVAVTSWTPRVFECTIPKSSMFLYAGTLGSDPYSEPCYASEALVIDRLIENE